MPDYQRCSSSERSIAPLAPDAEAMLRSELERGRLTGRGYHRVRRTARTLADLVGEVDGPISEGQVANALMLRARVGVDALQEAA